MGDQADDDRLRRLEGAAQEAATFALTISMDYQQRRDVRKAAAAVNTKLRDALDRPSDSSASSGEGGPEATH